MPSLSVTVWSTNSPNALYNVTVTPTRVRSLSWHGSNAGHLIIIPPTGDEVGGSEGERDASFVGTTEKEGGLLRE